ncbi:MAG: hypothetical protein RMI91_06635 [Gemmatales bacterium]|nr:hypothetical protein [Gemmatales bacterium]MDW7994313.1 hypothetical protein [Gemmatales bacterium]
MTMKAPRLCISVVIVVLLSWLAGCSDSTAKKPTVAQQGNNPKPVGDPGSNQSGTPNKPPFPLIGPSIPTVPTQVATPPQASHNTRPIGPLGVRQITLGLNDLRQAGILLANYYNENNSWPRNDNELRDALREMPIVYKAIQVGDYVFAPLSNPTLPPGPQTVLIYERLPDKAGIRLVLFGDGSVKRMTPGEFNQLKLPPP